MTNHEKHIIYWDEMAKTGRKDKRKIFGELFPLIRIKYLYAFKNSCEECQGKCPQCPIDWGEGICTVGKSPYKKWLHSKTIKDRKYWAAIIRDLPWRGK